MIQKYSTLKTALSYGEFWLIGGQAAGADGDIGDTNHAGMVQQQLLSDLVEEVNSETGLRLNPDYMDWDTLYKEIAEYLETQETPENPEKEVGAFILETIGFDEAKYNVVIDAVDPRDYGLEHLGWKRVKGNEIQTWTLTPDDIREIGDGLYDAYGEEVESETFNLEVYSTGKYYTEVPWEIINSGNIAALREFQTSF